MASGKRSISSTTRHVDWSAPDYASLHNQFDWTASGPRLRGEATPIYSYWPNAMERLKEYNPAAKLIFCLRHPSFRAFSHWRMESRETLSFEDAIGETGRLRVSSAQGGVHRAFSYVERGFYAAQIERLFHLFDRRQLLFLRTDRLWTSSAETLNAVYEHIGIDERFAADRRYVVPEKSREFGNFPAACRAALDEMFAADIQRTAVLTGLDLEDWLDPSYDEPMQRALA